MRSASRVLLLLVAAALAVLIGNYFLLYKPVTDRLALDQRNAGISLWAHYKYGVAPRTIIIDLRQMSEGKAPLDLWRSFFQCAAVIQKAKREPEVVVLQRMGTDIFKLKGSEFLEIGKSFESGENPIFLLRTLPEKLYRADGTRAYGTWTGGILGVLGKQMEELTDATKVWAGVATDSSAISK